MPMKNPAHPGRIVRGCLEELELSVTDGAKVLGVSRSTLSRILNERGSVSDEMAIRLSKAFGSTPEFWLKLQFNYDLAQVREKEDTIQVERYQPSQPQPELSA